MPAAFLKIAGQLIQDAVLTSVAVAQELNRHWWAAVECRQTADRRIAVEDSLGQPLQIVTRDQDGAEHVVFDGFVLRSRLSYEVFGSYRALLTGVTRSYKLGLTPQEAYFRKKALPDIAAALCGENGLQAAVQCAPLPPKNYVQWGESAFDFLHRLAYEHQGWIRPTAQGIEICDRFQGGGKISWSRETGLVDFRVRGGMSQPAFSGVHYDARRMTATALRGVRQAPAFSGAAGPMVAAVRRESDRLPPGYSYLDPRAATADEYRALLERESRRSIGSGIVAAGVSRDDALRAGDAVEIEGGLDSRGRYGLVRVVHRWQRTGYQNEFWCTPWDRYMAPAPPPPPRIGGFVPARVVGHNDPRKMGRLKVQYDWLEDGETAWARMASPHAGGDRGFLFLPEKGDEVLVGFEHGDPERPYIVGSLWNGVDQSPRSAFWGGDVEANDVKRIVTRSGHRIQFSDKEGKEAIVIATPTHLKIGMLENAAETGRSAIAVHSDNGDIVLSTPNGRIHFHSRYLSREGGA